MPCESVWYIISGEHPPVGVDTVHEQLANIKYEEKFSSLDSVGISQY